MMPMYPKRQLRQQILGDVNVDAFEQPSGPNLPPGFDTATATPLDYFELLFKTEMFGKLLTIQTIMLCSKRMRSGLKTMNLNMLMLD